MKQPLKTLLLLGLVLYLALSAGYGQPKKMVLRYPVAWSANPVLDKNFYWLTVLSRSRLARAAFQDNAYLSEWLDLRKRQLTLHTKDTVSNPAALLAGFLWQSDTTFVLQALAAVYDHATPVFDALIDRQVRPSGCYQRLAALSNREFYLGCWRSVFKGLTTIIDHYGLGTDFRYPGVDSASYDVRRAYYRDLLKAELAVLAGQMDTFNLFYEPSLRLALELMTVNERTEPVNSELLETRENRAVLVRVLRTNFQRYRYSAILVPGEGPELPGIALDPLGRARCELAAIRYRAGLAPFIIVSGGRVHPFHTVYTEALEMKKYLVREANIPAAAIIVEPQARHTTTNFRNAARLIIRYGIPLNKPVVCVSTKDQIDYILDNRFDGRNTRELGYLPFSGKQRAGTYEVLFYPVTDCLQIDPADPLDP